MHPDLLRTGSARAGTHILVAIRFAVDVLLFGAVRIAVNLAVTTHLLLFRFIAATLFGALMPWVALLLLAGLRWVLRDLCVATGMLVAIGGRLYCCACEARVYGLIGVVIRSSRGPLYHPAREKCGRQRHE